MKFAFPAPETVSLPIAGSDARYPVRRVFCVGRNYLDHIRELGNDEREPPIFFMKSADCIVQDGTAMAYPPATENFHYELELVVALASGGYAIPEAEALSHVYGYAVGLDMTRRDVQKRLIGKASPWELGKVFAQAAPCAAIHPVTEVGHVLDGRVHLQVNGVTKQDGNLNQMIWKLPEIIANLSQYFCLQAGDLIYTGTPAGVGPVVPGDVMVGEIEGLGRITASVVAAE